MKLLKFLFFSILILFTYSYVSFGQKKSELEQKRNEKLKEIDNIENLISKTKNEKTLSLAKISLISRKISIRNEIIDNYSNEIDEIDSRINILSGDINDKFNEVTKLKNEYSKILYNSYFRFRSFNNFQFLLSSNSINQAYRRLYFLREYTEHRKAVLIEINEEIAMIQSSISILNSEKEKKQNLIGDREVEKQKLSNENDDQKRMIKNNSKKETILLKQLKELQVAEKTIENEIEKLIREEALARAKKSSKIKNSETVLTKNFKDNKGKLPWPVSNGTIISYFGQHPHPVFKGVIIDNHGIDISTSCNSSVRCIFNGTISKIFAIKGSNFVIIIRHGDFLTVYQNIQNVVVKVGENVKTGQNIGSSFCDNDNNIATVHLEIWQELNKLNPTDWLSN
jgi:septal ring factor EnvC (AmiA/AmiB activator)